MPIPEKAVALAGVVTPFLTIALLAVVLRLHVRVTLLRNPGADDWLCFGAMCCALGTYIANMAGVAVGFGKPLWTLTHENQVMALKTIWISPPLWGFSSSLIKMSIVASYKRIWTGHRFRLLSNILFTLLSIFGLILFFGGILACIPVPLSWDSPTSSLRKSHYCLDIPLFMFATSVLNIIFDLLVLAIPVPLIRRLQITAKQKAALTGVFTVGVVVVVASIMRLVVIYQLKNTTDPSQGGVELGLWSGVELNIAIICACLPTLRPLLARVFPRLLGATAEGAMSWYGTNTGTRTGTGRRSQRTARDGNGAHHMGDLSPRDHGQSYTKPINVDLERGEIHANPTIQIEVVQADKRDMSYMDLD